MKIYSAPVTAALCMAFTFGALSPASQAAAGSPSRQIQAVQYTNSITAEQAAYARSIGISQDMIDQASRISDAEANQIIEKFTKDLAKAYEAADAATIYDAAGNAVFIDYAKLQKKYPNDPYLASAVKDANQNIRSRRTAQSTPKGMVRAADANSFSECFFTEAMKGLGLDIIKAMWGENVRDAINRKAWSKVSGLAMQNLEKKLGKAVAAKVAKTVASKFLPSGPVLGIAWVTAKCTWRQF